MTCLRDSYKRPINYLRISVTDRCNFRCVYCLPPEGVHGLAHADILTYEEIMLVASAAAELGISKIRLTGGEPLVRAGIVNLVRSLAAIPGIDDLALSTNGSLLAHHALALKEAGLRRVNISLDTMQPATFKQLTRTEHLPEVLAGIEQAEAVGLKPLKINMVAMRGINDSEMLEMAARTINHDWNIRFIELMPISQSLGWQDHYLSNVEIRERFTSLGPLEPDGIRANYVEEEEQDSSSNIGPARYFRFPGAKGTIGFISPISEHFCYSCNRLRLTADGRLRPCLLSDQEVDLRARLRQGATIDQIKEIIQQTTLKKPWQHHLDEGLAPRGRTMSEIGG